MIVRSAMNDGLSVTSRAAWKAASRAATFSSYRPSSSSQLTRCVCQPYASYRCTMSSLNAMIVLSSIEMWFSSYSSVRLPSCWVPAIDEASLLMPSSMSPSEAMQ